MRRLFRHTTLGLLLLGMLGPLNATAWVAVVQGFGLLEEEHGHAEEAGTTEGARLEIRGTLPRRRPARRSPVVSWKAIFRIELPVASERAFAVRVFRPLRVAPDGDDPESFSALS